MTTHLNIGIVGNGEQGEKLRKAAPRDRMQILAGCDRDAARAAAFQTEEPTASVYTHRGGFSRPGLLDHPGLNGVIAALPPQDHYELGVDALKYGLPVFLEKPPCRTLRELQHLADLEQDKVTAVGMNFRHAWGVQKIREEAKTAGGIARVAIEFHAAHPRKGCWGLTSLRWFLLAQAIHPLDLAHYLCDSPVERVAHSVQPIGAGTELNVSLWFSGGRYAHIQTSSSWQHFNFRLSVAFGNGNQAQTDLWSVTFCREQKGLLKRQEIVERPSPLKAELVISGYSAEMAAFFAAIRGELPAEHQFATLIPTYELIEDICRESDSGEEVVDHTLAHTA